MMSLFVLSHLLKSDMNLTRSARLTEDHLEHLIAARNGMNRIVRDMLASYDNANAQQKIRMRSIIHDSLSLAASCDSILENWQTMRRSIHRGDVYVDLPLRSSSERSMD